MSDVTYETSFLFYFCLKKSLKRAADLREKLVTAGEKALSNLIDNLDVQVNVDEAAFWSNASVQQHNQTSTPKQHQPSAPPIAHFPIFVHLILRQLETFATRKMSFNLKNPLAVISHSCNVATWRYKTSISSF